MTRECEFVKEALRFMFSKNVFGFRDAMPEEYRNESVGKVINDGSVSVYVMDGDGSEIKTTIENIKTAAMFDEYKRKASEILLKYADVVAEYNVKE